MDIRLDAINETFRVIDDQGEIHEYDLKKELHIDEATLGQEFLNQPVKYLFWCSILEKMTMYLDSEKYKMDVTEANLRDQGREFFVKSGIKSNAQMVDDYCKQQSDWKAVERKLINLTYMVKQLKVIVRAFEQRKDMLQSYGAQLRNEVNYGDKAGNVPNSSYR